MMVTSDTSRLFHVGSAGGAMMGAGPNSLSLGTTPVAITNQKLLHYWAEEIGADANTGTATITFPNSGFSGVPYVYVSAWSNDASSGIATVVTALSATQFTVVSSRATIIWRSLGTRRF